MVNPICREFVAASMKWLSEEDPGVVVISSLWM